MVLSVAQFQSSNFPWGAAVTMAGLFAAVLLLAMDERNRRKFATREDVYNKNGDARFCQRDDVNGLAQRIDKDMASIGRKTERNAGLFVAIDDRTGDLEEKVSRLEERQNQHWERLSEQMTQTASMVREVAADQKETAKMMQALALKLESLQGRKE